MNQFSFKFLIAFLALSLVGLPFLIHQADARGGGGAGFHGGGGGGFHGHGGYYGGHGYGDRWYGGRWYGDRYGWGWGALGWPDYYWNAWGYPYYAPYRGYCPYDSRDCDRRRLYDNY